MKEEFELLNHKRFNLLELAEAQGREEGLGIIIRKMIKQDLPYQKISSLTNANKAKKFFLREARSKVEAARVREREKLEISRTIRKHG